MPAGVSCCRSGHVCRGRNCISEERKEGNDKQRYLGAYSSRTRMARAHAQQQPVDEVPSIDLEVDINDNPAAIGLGNTSLSSLPSGSIINSA